MMNGTIGLTLSLTLSLAGSSASNEPHREPHREQRPESHAARELVPGTLEMREVLIPLGDGRHGKAERGWLEVPIVRADPSSKPIQIDVWRFPARAGAVAGAPPIFKLNGGPGWPGLEPGSIRWAQDIEPMIRYTDYVIVGQRGIGTSTPDTSCAGVAHDSVPAPDMRLSIEERAALLRARCAECKAHWEALGYDLRGLNALEAAADVDDIRRLLGYEKIAIWGGSFGSHWGMAIMRHFPDGVARALLTGMEGPDHTYDMPSGVLHSLERMARAAEAAPELAEFIPEDGLIAALEVVIAGVEEDPFEVEVRDPNTRKLTGVWIDAEAIRGLATGTARRVSSRGAMPAWPADIIRLHRGEFEPAALAILANGDGLDLPTASFFMLDCGSGISPARLEKLRSDPASAIVGDLGWFYETACSVWGADLGAAFRSDFKTDIPTVMVHGTWDINTPFDNAEELVPSFRDLHFIPVHGGSHGALEEALRLEPGFRELVMAFLTTGTTEGLPSEVTLPPIRWRAPG